MSLTAAYPNRRSIIVSAGIALLAISIVSFLTTSVESGKSITLLLAYAGGMAMLLTPWSFPLALGIVPLCKQGQTGRGVALALLFGAGLTVTLTVWGVAIGSVGGFFGLREIARYLSLLGGAVAYVLGLRTLALLRFPLLSGSARLPGTLHGRSEYLGAFAIGLLLGNMGLCCPDPVFLSMIPFLAARDRIMDSGVLAAAYGLGRATPLVAVVMLASAGVDSLQLVTRHKQAFDRALGWGLVAIGTLMVYGYSSLPQGDLVAVLLMVAPVVAYHVKAGSPRLRASAWLVAAITGTFAGLRVVRLVLLSLP